MQSTDNSVLPHNAATRALVRPVDASALLPGRTRPDIIDNRAVFRPKVPTTHADRLGEGHLEKRKPGKRRVRKFQYLMPVRVLVVDDSSVMRKIVERSLRQAGLDLSQVFEAGNGAETLSVLQTNQTDLILCDINIR